MSLRLPLSMAVTRVMVVVAGGQRFGIPVEHIRETLRLSQADIQNVGQQPALHHRGHVVPLLDLGETLGLATAARRRTATRVLIVAPSGEEVGSMVERFEDHFDLICKPPRACSRARPACPATALLGDGHVLLILNLKEMLGHAVAA